MIGQTLGNYRIVARLGSGSMGEVFLAEHQRIARRVAIKILNKDLTGNPQAVARFLDEARATSLIRHPWIVEVFDCDVDPSGRVYLVMEYLQGQTLATRLEKERRLPWPVACALARQVAVALSAAHKKGIVHRDVKPENVFLPVNVGDPARPVIKILDFGIAKLLSKDPTAPFRTIPGAMVGTPHYMAPEQCTGTDRLDRRADVYGLGCMLFTMISGRPPFEGSRLWDVIAAQAFQPPPSLRAVDPSTPRWLESLVARMLAKLPLDRPASMDAVARVLERAGRQGRVRPHHWIRDNPRWATLVAAACAALLIAGLWGGSTVRSQAAAAKSIETVKVRAAPSNPVARVVPPPAASVPAPSAPPPPAEARRPTATPAPAAPPRRAVARRSARPIVEMDGLVDL